MKVHTELQITAENTVTEPTTAKAAAIKALADETAAAKANARKALAALDAFDAIVEGYLSASGMSVARFGLEAGGQLELVYRLRRGTDFRRSTMRKVLDRIANGAEQVAP